jgi:hypothetical protein
VRRRSLALGMLRIGERRRGMMFGLQCSQARTSIFLCLQVRFRAHYCRLSSIIFRRTTASRARGGGCHDRLASVAHLLHGRPHLAAKQTGNSDQNKNEPSHRVARH